MGVIYFCGFETGSSNEINTLGTNCSIQNSTIISGRYSLQVGTSTNTPTIPITGLNLSTSGIRFNFRLGSTPSVTEDILRFGDSSGAVVWSLQITSTWHLRVIQTASIGLTATTGTFSLLANAVYSIQLLYNAAAAGALTIWVNTNLDINVTHSLLSNNIDRITTGSSGNIVYYYDDFLIINTATQPPVGQILARQNLTNLTSNPTYDNWSSVPFPSGSDFDWGVTPYDTNGYRVATAANAQTMFVEPITLQRTLHDHFDVPGETSNVPVQGLGGTNEAAGQSFIAQSSFNLSYLDIVIDISTPTGPPANFIDSIQLDVCTGSITGTSVGTSTLLGSTYETIGFYHWYRFTFSTPVPISSGTTYYLRLTRTGSRDTTNVYFIGVNIVTPYSFGTYYQEDNGSWSTPQPTYGIAFRCWSVDGIDYTPVGSIINAIKVAAVGKSSSGGAATTHLLRYRANGVDYDSSDWTGISSSDQYVDSLQLGGSIPLIDTITNLSSCEIGGVQGATSQLFQIEDIWLMVDFTYFPYPSFHSSETEPYTPLDFESTIADAGDDQALYAPIDLANTASIFSSPITPLSIIFNDYTPYDLEQLVEESESDFYPNFDVDISWYISFSVLIDPSLVIVNDYSPPDTDQLIDDTSEEQAWYFPIDELLSWFIPISQSPNLIFYDYSPNELEQLTEDSEGDYYPETNIDIAWNFALAPPISNILIFVDYSPLDQEQLIENEPIGHIPSSYLMTSPIGIILLLSTSQWDNQSDNPENYLDDSSDPDFYPDMSIDNSWYFVQVVAVFNANLIYNDYSPLELEQLIEASEGDFYPDFSVDMSWQLAAYPIISSLIIFNEYVPYNTELLIEESEADYYPTSEEELQWLIPNLFTITTLFGSWVYSVLGGQLPTIQPTGGIETFGGGYGGATWSNTAFTGAHALQIQSNFGGVMGWDTSIPNDNLVITGNELFTLYYTILDNIPNQIELQFYEATSGTWKIAYLGSTISYPDIASVPDLSQIVNWSNLSVYVDNFGLGGTFKGVVPNVPGFWLSVTITAADLGLVAGNIITGLAWGVYNTSGTSTVVFSDLTTTGSNLQTFVFDDYSPTDPDELIEDIGAEDSWYQVSGNITSSLSTGHRNWSVVYRIHPFFFPPPAPASMMFSQVEVAENIPDDFGDEDAWYNVEGPVMPSLYIAHHKWSVVYRIQPTSLTPALIVDLILSQMSVDDNIIEELEGDYYPSFDVDGSRININLQTQLFVFLEYNPLETDQLIEDTGEGDFYPDFSVDLSWFFVQRIITPFIFNEYIPYNTELLIEDFGEEEAWYPSQEDIITPTLFSLSLMDFGLEDYSPLEVEQLTEDTSEEPAWYPTQEDIITPTIFFQSLMDFGLEDYSPQEIEQLTEDTGEGDFYPEFGNENPWYITQIIPVSTEFYFNEYNPPDSEQLIEDLGDEQSWYPPQDDFLSWFYTQIIQQSILTFNDYIPYDTDQLIDDLGNEDAWYPSQEDIITPTLFSQALLDFGLEDYNPLELEQLGEDTSEGQAWYPSQEDIITPTLFSLSIIDFGLEDYSPLELEQLIEGSEGDFYPDFSMDLSLYFNQVFVYPAAFYFADYSPYDTDQLIEDAGDEQTWYPPTEELLSWFIPSAQSRNLIFNDYSPDEVEQLLEDIGDEQSWYPPIEELISWFIIAPPVSSFLVVNEYIPYNTELLIDDLGDEQSWYPALDELLSWFIPIAQSPNLVFDDYSPSDTDQLLEDTSEEQSWYPAKEEEIQWYISTLLNINFVFNDYSPLESEPMIEESEGDYYPSFEIDPSSWFFIIGSNIFMIIPSTTVEEDPNIYLEDTGEETGWYQVESEVVSVGLPLNIVILLIASQWDNLAADYVELYSEELEGDYYPPQEEQLSWFFLHIVTPTILVFDDYSPEELEQLTEESEGDFYPDFSIDMSPIFSIIPAGVLTLISMIQWEAIPLEMETVTDDTGEEPWWYSFDINVVLISGTSIQVRLFMPLANTLKLYFKLIERDKATGPEFIFGG